MIRRIHLDFHTAADTRDVGVAFDPERFAQTLADAHVNALATPGKCQYGHTYFNTALGQPHPHLVRPDLFPATVAACVRRGIRVQAYFTLGLDDVAAARHPDWRQRFRDGSYAAWGAKHICFASPYIDEVVIPEAREMLQRCPGLCGFWFDICLYVGGAFYSPGFEQAARTRLGAAADDELQRWLLARQLIREGCQKINAAVGAVLPEAENYFNTLVVPGEPENIALQPIQEVENPVLFGGPEVMTATVRWLRWHGRPVVGLVSRFQGPWMDPGTLRTPDQLYFDVARTAVLGCHVSMGDHRHPDGTLDPEVYRRIGTVYAELERCDPWLEGATPCREAVLLTDIERGTPHLAPTLPAATLHAARLLEELGIQFDLAAPDEPLPPADLVIWPEHSPGSARLAAALESHVHRGGALLAMGQALAGREDFFGVRASGETPSVAGAAPTLGGAGHVMRDAAAAFFYRPAAGVPIAPFSHLAELAAPMLEAGAGVQVLADRLGVASDRPLCAGAAAGGPAIVQRGRVIYSAVRLFEEQMRTGSPIPRDWVRVLCERLLPHRLVRHNAGLSVAAHLHRAPHGHVLHLVHWALERWSKNLNPVAEFPTLGPIAVTLTLPARPARISLEPAGQDVAFQFADHRCTFTVPALRIWQVVVFHASA